jgi:hypothetical protein
MGRQKWSWTEHQLNKLNKVRDVLEELKDYKPLTLRQVYYQLVGKEFIENEMSEYNMLSGLLKWARIDGRVSWDDIEDRGRIYHDLTGWRCSDNFIRASINQFLQGYRRDLLQTQDKYIEVWIEKDALSGIATRIANRYSVSVVVDRGFTSMDFLHKYRLRIEDHPNQSPVMLYFRDFDPSGLIMLSGIKTTLEDEMEVNRVEFKPVALTEEDIIKYSLPHKPKAIKKGDTRTPKHVERYGELAVELDALDVKILEEKIKDAIEAEIDIDLFNVEVEKEEKELNKLNILKGKATKAFNKIISSERR